jgi:DNA-binding transcriptional LysR family regulator
MARGATTIEARTQVLRERMVARLRLRHLRLLTALEFNPTLREAALEVGITQPAASQILRELEDLLEVQLFERHARGLRATDAGRLLAEQSRQMLGGVDYTAEALAAAALGQRKPLQIAAIPAAIAALLAPKLPELRRRLQGWRLTLLQTAPEAVPASLQSGLIQVALLRRPELLSKQRMVFTDLLADDLAIVASPRHRAFRRQPQALADLQEWPWSIPAGTHAAAQAFGAACRAAHFAPRQAEVQSMAPEFLVAITGDAQTLVPVPRSLAAGWLSEGQVAEIQLTEPIALPPLGALRRADETSAAVRALIETLLSRG